MYSMKTHFMGSTFPYCISALLIRISSMLPYVIYNVIYMYTACNISHNEESTKAVLSTQYIRLSIKYYIGSLEQDCSISIANTLKILQSCTKTSIYLWLSTEWNGSLDVWIRLVIDYSWRSHTCRLNNQISCVASYFVRMAISCCKPAPSTVSLNLVKLMARGLVKLISTLHGVPFLASSFGSGFLELSTSWKETHCVKCCGGEFSEAK